MCGEPAVNTLSIFGIAQGLVGVSDALAGRQQREGQLLRLHVHITVNIFKPGHAVARSTLEFESLYLALGLVTRQALGHRALGTVEHFGQRNRVFHSQLGARTNGKVGSVSRITNQDDVVLVPALTQHAVELEPDPRAAQVARVGDEPMAVQQISEQVFAEGDGLIRRFGVKPGARPGRLWGFHNKSGHLGIEAVGMQVEPAELGFFKSKREGIELFLGAQPDETTGAQVDARIEVCFMLAAHGGEHTVGTNHQVVIFGIDVWVGYFDLPLHLYT